MPNIMRNGRVVQVAADDPALRVGGERSPAERAAAIKHDAGRRILARFPEWRQRNMTARGAELLRIRVDGNEWTQGERAEADALQAAWDWIKAVRAHSDRLEADPGADITAGWPE